MTELFSTLSTLSSEADILSTKYKHHVNYKVGKSVDALGNISIVMPTSLPPDLMAGNLNTIKNAERAHKVRARLQKKLALKQ